jgi:hypothetical protein
MKAGGGAQGPGVPSLHGPVTALHIYNVYINIVHTCKQYLQYIVNGIISLLLFLCHMYVQFYTISGLLHGKG